MERKSVAGSIRNKERSKTKFLEAVGKILKTTGFRGLKVNNVAAKAGVDKKMIYMHFGGMDDLIDEYIHLQDYWKKVTTGEIEKNKLRMEDGGRSFVENMLFSQFDYVYKNKEAQNLLLWRLYESRKSLKKLIENQEEDEEYIFKQLKDIYFGERLDDFRAIMAILVSGLYYLNMYSAMNGSIFCGIDLETLAGRDKIKKATAFLVKQTYEHL